MHVSVTIPTEHVELSPSSCAEGETGPDRQTCQTSRIGLDKRSADVKLMGTQPRTGMIDITMMIKRTPKRPD